MLRPVGLDDAIVEFESLLVERDQRLPGVGGKGVAIDDQHQRASLLCANQAIGQPTSRMCGTSALSPCTGPAGRTEAPTRPGRATAFLPQQRKTPKTAAAQ